jgi:hypothetical protein
MVMDIVVEPCAVRSLVGTTGGLDLREGCHGDVRALFATAR